MYSVLPQYHYPVPGIEFSQKHYALYKHANLPFYCPFLVIFIRLCFCVF